MSEAVSQEEVNIFVQNLAATLKKFGIKRLASIISKEIAGDVSLFDLVRDNIITTVSNLYGLSQSDILSSGKRKQDIMESKILCIILFSRYLTTITHKQIGEYFTPPLSKSSVTHAISSFKKNKVGKGAISDRYAKIFSKEFFSSYNICINKINIYINQEKNNRLID